MPAKLKTLLTSRKFWAAAIGLIVLIVQSLWPGFPLDSGQVAEMIYLLIAFIVGTSIESGLAQSNP